MPNDAPANRITKVQRWLDLISFLAVRRTPVTVEQLMEGVPAYAEKWEGGTETDRKSVRRTFERDKDELREFGLPLETVQFSINYGAEQLEGYRVDRSALYLPVLRLLEEEAQAAGPSSHAIAPAEAAVAFSGLRTLAQTPAFPLAREARSALRKLSFDLASDLLPPGGPARGDRPPPILNVPAPGTERAHEALATLSPALLKRKEVSFFYRGITRQSAEDRRVQPWGLFMQQGRWYLVGFDLDREAPRIFRADRMENVQANRRAPNEPDYAVPGDFSLRDYQKRDAWDLPGDESPRTEVTVRFDFPRSLWAERNGHGTLLETDEDGGSLRSFRVRDAGPFLRWLLTLEGEARIESPRELAQEYRALVEDVLALYAGDAQPEGPVHG